MAFSKRVIDLVIATHLNGNKETPVVEAQGDYKRKAVQGLYTYSHFEHPNGSFVQIRNSLPFDAVHQGIDGNRTKFDNYEDLKSHLSSLNESIQVDEGLRLKATHTHEDGIHSAKVYHDNDWDEYRTKFYKHGKHVGEDADDFQSSLEDANDSAKAGINHMAKHHNTNESVEQVDEISHELTQRYYDKARDTRRGMGYGWKPSDESNPSQHEANRAFKRSNSMSKAYHRIEDHNNPVNPSVHDMQHMDTGEAYDYTQTHDHVKDGDVLHMGPGQAGIMYKAWPTMVHGDPGKFHTFEKPDSIHAMDRGRYSKSADLAHKVAHGISHDAPVHKAEWNDEFNETFDQVNEGVAVPKLSSYLHNQMAEYHKARYLHDTSAANARVHLGAWGHHVQMSKKRIKEESVQESKYNAHGQWGPSKTTDGKGGSNLGSEYLNNALKEALDKIAKANGKVPEKKVEEAYSKTAVDKVIKSSRSKISGKQAKAIHALLKGYQKEDEPSKSVKESKDSVECPSCEGKGHHKMIATNKYGAREHSKKDCNFCGGEGWVNQHSEDEFFKHGGQWGEPIKESVDDFKASGSPTDMGNVSPKPGVGKTLVDYTKNFKATPDFEPLYNFLMAHKVEVTEPSPDDAQNTGDMFSAASTPTYDKAAHRQGNDQDQTDAAWNEANPDEDEWQYQQRLQKSREKAKAAIHTMWGGNNG